MHESLQSTIQRTIPYPVAFASITGSHAFGCSSPFSDYDVHGVHLLPQADIFLLNIKTALKLDAPPVTIERRTEHPDDGNEVDIATHDLTKFILLMLNNNGNVLEDVLSPLVVITSPIHEELQSLAKGCFTKGCAKHYQSMRENQQRHLKSNPIKRLIHAYRCLLMGIHLMRSCELEMHLLTLATLYGQPQVHDLIAYKISPLGTEPLTESVVAYHTQHIDTLIARLDKEAMASQLPDEPTVRDALFDLIVRVRKEN